MQDCRERERERDEIEREIERERTERERTAEGVDKVSAMCCLSVLHTCFDIAHNNYNTTGLAASLKTN